MEYTTLAGIEKKASRLVYGSVGPMQDGRKEEAFACLDAAWAAGFRVFDTAQAYGKAEEILGLWMESRGTREELILMDKGFNPTDYHSTDVYAPATLHAQIEASLEKLRTDYLDLYVLHRDDDRYPVDEIVDTLNEYKNKGVIRHFGGSNWRMERLIETQEYAKRTGQTGFEVCSPGYSIADLQFDPWGGSVTLTGKQNHVFREWLRSNQMPVIHYSGLARGYVSGKFDPDKETPIETLLPEGTIKEYDCEENRALLRRMKRLSEEKDCTMSQLAVAYVLHQGMNVFPIVAPGVKHVKEVTGAFDVHLTAEDLHMLKG